MKCENLSIVDSVRRTYRRAGGVPGTFPSVSPCENDSSVTTSVRSIHRHRVHGKEVEWMAKGSNETASELDQTRLPRIQILHALLFHFELLEQNRCVLRSSDRLECNHFVSCDWHNVMYCFIFQHRHAQSGFSRTCTPKCSCPSYTRQRRLRRRYRSPSIPTKYFWSHALDNIFFML